MPLFNSNSNDSARRTSADGQSPTRKKSVFSSGRNSPPQSTGSGSGSGSGFFQRRRSNSDSEANNHNTKRNGFFSIGRNNDIEDEPSIRAARDMVANAEVAEKDADRALNEARQRVRLAREHVQALEREAREE